MSVTHELKTWPTYFAALWDGRKTFEVRHDDRGFQAGDLVRLREYDAHSMNAPRFPASLDDAWRYTGREVHATIGYVLHGIPSANRNFGTPGFTFGEYVVFSLLNAHNETAPS